MVEYEFTNDWFEKSKTIWSRLFSQSSPQKLLEVGSFEGQSACYLIEHLASRHPISLTCVDTWAGGIEHANGSPDHADMAEVERRFLANTRAAMAQSDHEVEFVVRKGDSRVELCKLIAEGRSGTFDFVFVDGSHMASDVLADAVHAFQLTKVGGTIVFDDYLWQEKTEHGADILRRPKPAIDAFTNLFAQKLFQLQAPLHQVFVRKTAD